MLHLRAREFAPVTICTAQAAEIVGIARLCETFDLCNEAGKARRRSQLALGVHEGLWRYQHAERTLGMLQTSRLK